MQEIVDETDIFVDNTNSLLAVPHRESSLRQRKKRMLAHARVPGTRAILIREIPKQSVWKPIDISNDASKSTFFPDRKLFRQASRRTRSDGFNLNSNATESCPLLPDIDNVFEEVRNTQKGVDPHLSIHLSNVENEQLDTSIPAMDLSSELSSSSVLHSPSKSKGTPDSVRSKPLPAYVPPQEISRRASRARASRSGGMTDN